MSRATRIAVFLPALSAMLLATGCESTPLTAPTDGQILLTAFPAAVVLEPGTVDSATVTLTAQVLGSQGAALEEIEVIFQTTGGTLGSAPPPGEAPIPIKTDENGFAVDTLTLTTADPDEVDVTASSSTVTATVTVTKTEASANSPPYASIFAEPAGYQLLGDPVIFDGTGSGDDEGDPITCYQWEINSSAPIVNPGLPCDPPNSRCEIEQGPSRSVINRSYATEQSLTVTLRVSGNPGALCDPNGPTEDGASFSPDSDVLFYDIYCDATDPTAEAGPPQQVSLGGGASVSVTLDGSASFDDESAIIGYTWSCGNGTASQPGTICQGSGLAACVTCEYTAEGVFSATLTVVNACGLTDADTVGVTVNP